MSEAIVMTVEAPQRLSAAVSGEQTVQLGVGSPSGTAYYPALLGKPSIEGHVLVGDSTIGQIGVGEITPQEIDRLIYG